MNIPEKLWEPGNRAIVGLQYGDEGKGKVTNLSETDMYGRGNGGNNAGHTFLDAEGREVNTHLLPSGINLDGKLNIIGHGTYVEPVSLVSEINNIRDAGYAVTPQNLAISIRAHVTFPAHIMKDELKETGQQKQGSTKRGIAFVAADKWSRDGLRFAELLNMTSPEIRQASINRLIAAAQTYGKNIPMEDTLAASDRFHNAVQTLKPFIADTATLVRGNLAAGQTITAEGAQAFGLDINYGKYPFVTSSDTTVLGLLGGLGLNHKQVGVAWGVAKAIQSKVGGGPMVTAETDPEIVDMLRGVRGAIDSEYGKSTGRARDVGYLDLVLLRAAVEANGLDAIVLNKVDSLRLCVGGLRVAAGYMLDDKYIEEIPADATELARCVPAYKSFPPFNQTIQGVTDYDVLPQTVKDYVEYSEEFVGVPFAMLGTGPGGNDVIRRR